MKRLARSLVMLLFSILAAQGVFLWLILGRVAIRSNLPPMVTAATIRQLQLGMRRSDVEALLGKPLSAGGSRSEDCEHSTLLTYFTKPAFAPVVRYPMLWVALCGERVYVVRARAGDPIDDEDVYWLRTDLRWESPEFRELFP
jgi:hypothetical protein